MDWRENLIDDTNGLRHLLAETRRVAVLGIRSELFSYRPAHFVPAYLAEVGFEVIPVPVYEPEVTTMLGKPVYRSLLDVPGEIDLVDVFRRADQLSMHLAEVIEKRPKAVWLQLGILDDKFAEEVARAGIKVVQDRCLMVDHRRLFKPPTSF
ncbi:MAG: CoA-binding protein [Acidobacteriota bacterium]